MSPDEKALLETIWESPLDNTPRLVYADWLQETDIPENVARAEFIRVQCEMVKLDHWTRRYKELKARADQLCKEFDRDHLVTESKENSVSTEYIRGFQEPYISNFDDTFVHKDVFSWISKHRMDAPTWNVFLAAEENREELFNAQRLFPAIRRLMISTTSVNNSIDELTPISAMYVESLCRREWFNLRDLGLVMILNDAICSQLLTSPHLSRLEALRLNIFTESKVVKRFFHSAPLTQLKCLLITDEDPEGGVLQSVQQIDFSVLRSFTLNNWGYYSTDKRIFHLCRCKFLPELRELIFTAPLQALDSFTILANCSGLSGLKSLQIIDASKELKGLKAILESPNFLNLVSIKTTVFDPNQRDLAESLLRPRFGDFAEIELHDDSEVD